MRWVLLQSMTEAARAAGMTAYNLFVSLNQHAFSTEGGKLKVDYRSLMLSLGPVAPVQASQVVATGGSRLEVDFERNPLHQQCDAYDAVHLYVYSPSLGQGYLAAPVYRRQKKVSVLLPEQFEGTEVHIYLYVSDQQGRCSETAYGGCLTVADGAIVSNEEQDNADPNANQSTELQPAAEVSDTEIAGTAHGRPLRRT